jgi:hypothetical protein
MAKKKEPVIKYDARGREIVQFKKRKRVVKPLTPEQEARRLEALDLARPVTIRLRFRHYINGIVYGPGVIKVRGDLARQLSGNDSQAAEVENDFYDRNGRAFIIGGHPGSYSKHQVAYETFDRSLEAAAPGVRVGGKQ